MLSHCCRIALAALLTLTASMSASASDPASQTLVVLSADRGFYTDIIDQLTENAVLVEGSYRLAVLSRDEEPPLLPGDAISIITIGTRAAEAVYQQRPSVPVLSALITESGFTYLAGKYYDSVEGATRQGVSAIYLDQPLHRMYRLGVLAIPDARKVGVLTGGAPSTGADIPLRSRIRELGQALKPGQGVEIDLVAITNDVNPITVLRPVISNSDFVIALPGKQSINVSAAKWILKLGSQSRTPVIAYSKKYAASGALASVYTSAANVAEEISNVLATQGANQRGQIYLNKRGQIYLPKEFSIEINESVAKVLGLELRDEDYYHREIERLEGGQ